jgi:UDP-glucose 4-epimerase
MDLIWAAGTGRISAGGSEMRVETETVAAVMGTLGGAAGEHLRSLFYASSAGALWGGHGSTIITDETAPAPLTAYGQAKLEQEALVTALGREGICRTIIGRFSNIFGLAHGWLRPKGLVSVVVRTTLMNQAASVFVSPDTRRDYLFATDAARMALALMDPARNPADATTRIISQGSTLTVLDIIQHVGRVTRRRVPVTFRETPETALQPLTLAFAPRQGVLATVPTSSFPACIRLLSEGRLST